MNRNIEYKNICYIYVILILYFVFHLFLSISVLLFIAHYEKEERSSKGIPTTARIIC